MGGRLGILFVTLVLGGCLQPAPQMEEGPSDDTAPILALHLSEPVRVEGPYVHEPALAQGPDGTLYVAGSDYGPLPEDYLEPLALWKSVDEGQTWNGVPTGDWTDLAIGDADVDLAVGQDGVLYYATELLGERNVGHMITVGVTSDGTSTWSWQVLSVGPLVHRPWVDVAPDGSAHVVWNDGTVVHHAASTDGGNTWLEMPPVHVPGSAGRLAAGPSNELAVRILPYHHVSNEILFYPGQDGVAVSSDGGLSWTFRTVPGNRDYRSDDPARWADPVCFDSEGTLFTAWGEDAGLVLASSGDLGTTWNVVSLGGGNGMVWNPFLRGGDVPGKLAITWFTRPEAETNFTAHVALITQADGETPRLVEASFASDLDGGRGGEYIQTVFLQGGGLGLVTALGAWQQGGATGFVYRSAHWA